MQHRTAMQTGCGETGAEDRLWGDLAERLRDLSGRLGELELAPAERCVLSARLATADAQLTGTEPSPLLLRIALLSLRRRLCDSDATALTELVAPTLDDALRRLPS